ncbi:MAG: glycoside hydrolase family 3 C-terminal domain-containing protein [Saprospirales bacterium]|nr:glycoside hydrolase family 3 C-terminal domain-containing protein [Saprospirales bacterium]
MKFFIKQLNIQFKAYFLLFIIIVFKTNLFAYENPFLNTTATIYADSMAKKMIAEISLKEKISMLSGDKFFKLKFGIPFIFKGHLPNATIHKSAKKYHLPALIFTDGPRGVVTKPQTNFPAPITRACTWNPLLEEQVGIAMGTEATFAGANLIGAPCINLLRHPANGRAQESYGEDSYLVSQFGTALVRGIQEQGVMSCVKHFALNSIENTRYTVDVKISEKVLNEIYLPHFKACIDVGAASIMSAYNKVNGEYCAENENLLTTTLRKQLGFKGFVQSDWDFGVRSTASSLLAKMNVEMPYPKFYKPKKIKEAIANKEIKVSTINDLVYDILYTRFLFQFINQEKNRPKPNYEQHNLLAKRICEEGTVLLKNENQTLPLIKTKIKTILLVGRLLHEKNDGDNGSSIVKTMVQKPIDVFKKFGKENNIKILTVENVTDKNLTQYAQQADVVIFITGTKKIEEGEFISMNGTERKDASKPAKGIFKKLGRGGDRYQLNLPKTETDLITKIAAINKNTICYLIGGSAIMMEEFKNQVPAILFSGYYGMNGAETMLDILFGKVNPSGKLPFTIPANFSQLPVFPSLPKTIEYGYFHGYTLIDELNETPAFPFGFGLSYTTFQYTDAQLNKTVFTEKDTLEIELNVKNIGTVDGAETIQFYVHFEHSNQTEYPKKLLKAFTKVVLQKSELQKVFVKIPIHLLSYFDSQTHAFKLEKMKYNLEIANSSQDKNAIIMPFEIQ